jgi:uncharacterized membrane protein HdeD (DUF308 family)
MENDMSDGPAVVNAPEGADVPYCRFGKRYLDGFSWLAPVTNNWIADLFNLEFVHEQLFFIEGDRVTDNVGFSEKGTRFNEADFGKPIRCIADLEAQGYWLTGRRYHPEAAREALAQLDDGYYYSFFSNQCQDWADRLRRSIERVERERGLPPLPGVDDRKAGRYLMERAPTVPASVMLGVVALVVGMLACFSPVVTAERSVRVLGLFFIVSGVSDVVYALHARAWSKLVMTALFGVLHVLGGALLFFWTDRAADWVGLAFACTVGAAGLARIAVAARSRPFRQWVGTLIAGVALLVTALLLVFRLVGQTEILFGWIVGANLILGGVATLWLHWTAAREDAGSGTR